MSNNPLQKPIILIGGGGHASVIVDILKRQKREILAVISPDDTSQRKVFEGINVLQNDTDVFKYKKEDIFLINGIGKLPGSELRLKVNSTFKKQGYLFETIISDTASVSPYAILEEGVQVFPGVIINAGAKIGCDTVINTRAIIEHDVMIGENNFISPGAIICGQCKTGNNVYVGAGATVIQNIELGADSSVMANALVTANIAIKQKVYAARAIIK